MTVPAHRTVRSQPQIDAAACGKAGVGAPGGALPECLVTCGHTVQPGRGVPPGSVGGAGHPAGDWKSFARSLPDQRCEGTTGERRPVICNWSATLDRPGVFTVIQNRTSKLLCVIHDPHSKSASRDPTNPGPKATFPSRAFPFSKRAAALASESQQPRAAAGGGAPGAGAAGV